MIKGKSFNIIIGIILIALIASAKLGSTYAEVGDNKVKDQNLYTYQDNNHGVHIRTDCRPGYTQVTATDEIYYGSYKTVVYHESGYRAGRYYRICEEKNDGLGVCIYTRYHAVGPDVVRRYHKGTVSRTADEQSGTAEKYSKTVYRSELNNKLIEKKYGLIIKIIKKLFFYEIKFNWSD